MKWMNRYKNDLKLVYLLILMIEKWDIGESTDVISVPLNAWPLRGIAPGPNKGGAITVEFFKLYNKLPKQQALQVSYVAFSYMVLFSGYYYIHSFTSVIFKLSFIGFSLQYFFYALASLLGPSFGRRFGLKFIIILSSFGYLLYCGSIISGIEIFYLISASIVGICAGFIWLQQGIFITEVANRIQNDEEVGGALSGLFYGIFNFCFVFGNLISLIVFVTGVQVFIIQWIMFAVCCI